MSIQDDLSLPAAIAMAIPVTGGYLSGLFFTEGAKKWNASLKRPSSSPPKAAFPIVWTSLYGCMGYASFLVWREAGGFQGSAKLPLLMYGTQLALNFSWFPITFGKRTMTGGLIIISLLDVAVAVTAGLFYNVKPAAGYLMVPYLAWLSLATTLNYTIWRDNTLTKNN